MSTQSRVVPDLLDHDHPVRGDLELTKDTCFICCPGCGWVLGLKLGQPGQGDGVHRWNHSGTAESLTLRPSINHVGCWHGWLTDGIFTPC